jgi:AP endonuclease-1
MAKRAPAPRLPEVAAAAGRVRILSWNVNGLASVMDRPGPAQAFKAVLDAHLPDMVFLQEIKLQEMNVCKFAKRFPGFDAHFSCSTGKKGYAGTALLVRQEFAKQVESVSFGIDDEEVVGNDEGRSITVSCPGFYFVGLYVVNSGEGLVRLDLRTKQWDVAVRKYVASLSKTKPVILGGDLNVAHRDDDVYNFDAPHLKKQAGCTVQERASFSSLLAEDDYVDSFRALHPHATGWYSYWSTRAGNRAPNKGLRLDYYVVPRAMMQPDARVRLHDSWIVADAPADVSDHAPVCCDVVLAEGVL